MASEVIIATESPLIMEAARSFGAKAVMTSASHASGTDRVAEAASVAVPQADVIVNLQGDEPLIRPEMIDDVIMLMADSRADMGTLAKKIESPEQFEDPNVVKVVCGLDGYALYFSRAPIPYYRDGLPGAQAGPVYGYKHIGIYAYRKEGLKKLAGLKPVPLEEAEKLEQLRALSNGMKIKVKETSFETIGVDTPEDLAKVDKWLSTYS